MSTIELRPQAGQARVIHQFSRFNKHSIYVDQKTGRRFLETYRPQTLRPSEDDVTYVVTPQNEFRPDLISYHFYDTPLLAWAICLANNVFNPWDRLFGLTAGRIIRIPSTNTIFTEIL